MQFWVHGAALPAASRFGGFWLGLELAVTSPRVRAEVNRCANRRRTSAPPRHLLQLEDGGGGRVAAMKQDEAATAEFCAASGVARTAQGRFHCGQCGKTTQRLSTMRQHLEDHRLGRLTCQVCGKGFPVNASTHA